MCGLVGLVYRGQNGMFGSDISIFSDMLYMDALRGEDSVGVAALFTDNSMHMLKDSITPVSFFLADKAWDKLDKKLLKNGKAIIGHNRKATKGSVSDENAHPWLIDNKYLFIHNGTLHNHKTALRDTEVDSEALGEALVRCSGDPEKISEVLSKLFGAWACMWLDQEQNKLYAIRNKERPLWIGKTNTQILFASELGMMMTSALRNNSPVTEQEQLDEDTLYELKLDEYTSHWKKTKIEIKKVQPILTKASRKNGHKHSALQMESGANTGYNIFFQGSPSQKSAKKFRYAYGGAKINFWVDSCFPSRTNAHNPKSVWVVKGTAVCLEDDVMHEVHGLLDELPQGGLKTHLAQGTIMDCQYDAIDNKLIIYVQDIEKHAVYMTMGAQNETSVTQH